MGYWTSRGLRGSALEETINLTNDRYRREGLALVQKIPTPIVPVEMDTGTRIIHKAYFDRKSTVDYIGVMNGIAMCFDAKETGKKSLPFSNIHPHQIEFMKDFAKQGGISFLLVHFTEDDAYYLMPLETLCSYYEAYQNGDGGASIPREAFQDRYHIEGPCPYLPYLTVALQYWKDLNKKP